MFIALMVYIVLTLVTVVYIGGSSLWADRIEYRKRYHRPLICVCHLNGKIGVVLRRDYDKTSRKYWRPHYAGKDEHYSKPGMLLPLIGRRLNVSPVFVFEHHSLEYFSIYMACYVEQAVFEVPEVPEDKLNPINDAYQYIHNPPWKGGLITW